MGKPPGFPMDATLYRAGRERKMKTRMKKMPYSAFVRGRESE